MSHAAATDAEQFPSLSPVTSNRPEQDQASSANQPSTTAPQDGAPRRSSTSASRRTRGASLLQNFMESNPPLGAWQAIGEDTAKGPTIPEIRDGSYSVDGWSHEGQLEKRHYHPHDIQKRRNSRASSLSKGSRGTRPTTANATAPGHDLRTSAVLEDDSTMPEHSLSKHAPADYSKEAAAPLISSKISESLRSSAHFGPDETGEYPNGYRFPKKYTWQQSFAIYGKAFWKFFITIKGFVITIYALNVVAWGAMIFFLLIPGATPAMCKSYPDCGDKRYSARQIWIENTSQILTALFCVTAFGLLPWRLRDFYYMIKYQAFGDYDALRKLAGFYRSWYRLPGSDELPEHLGPPSRPANLKMKKSKDLEQNTEEELAEIADLEANPAVPLPPWSMPDAPLTGIRARPTKFSALAWMIWAYIWNTLFQVGLCVVMWGFNRFQRDKAYFSALTALFIVLGCGTGIVAGIVVGREGGVIKKTEGIPVKDYDTPETPEDYRERLAREEKKSNKQAEKARKKHGEMLEDGEK